MKIIDLLNMIAEGKEAPKKIVYKEMLYVFNSNLNAYQRPYYDEDGYKYSLGYHPKDGNILMDLNETVEIVEEDIPQPEDVLSFTLTDKVWTPRQARELIENFRKISEKLKRKEDNNKIEEINNAYYHETQDRINEIFKNKINEIIDKINNME